MNGFITLITGASSGMGLATSKEFLSLGATVIGVALDFDNMEEDLGDKFIPITANLTDPEKITEICNFVKEKYGILDTLFCNAGRSDGKEVDQVDLEHYEALTGVMLRAPVLLTKGFAELLQKSPHASIIHTCSIASYALGKGPTYRIAKTGLNNFTRNSAMFFGGKVRVNSICPGVIRTGIVDAAGWDAYEKIAVPVLPSRRLGQAWEIAKLCLSRHPAIRRRPDCKGCVCIRLPGQR
ncbi:3-oxoacyl-[acyl-carrier-protein] reductase FabG [Clostridia bacterium]|nr:3-oxoacyl-[acyl-carrier-protein] reductase FabG [Clostridia bacterium]